MNLIDSHNSDIILELNLGLILIYHLVNYSQMVTLFIVVTEKKVMAVIYVYSSSDNVLYYIQNTD